MTTKATVILIAFLILLGAGAYFVLRDETDVNTTPPATTNELIRVTSPLPNASVTSPLTVTGEARGNWYFEASFPVRILDANGKVLGEHYAEAQGEWMTTNFVPFRATLVFATSTTPTGTLVLEKDNPSGLPENAAEVRIPVRFSTVAPATETKTVKLYFYSENMDKDADGNTLCSSQGLVAFNRAIPLTNTPIQDAVRELLKGPTASERLQAPNTEFPLADVTLVAASLNNGILTFTFNDPQNKTGGGSCRVNILRAQIEATAKQFGQVTSVRFKPESLFQP